MTMMVMIMLTDYKVTRSCLCNGITGLTLSAVFTDGERVALIPTHNLSIPRPIIKKFAPPSCVLNFLHVKSKGETSVKLP